MADIAIIGGTGLENLPGEMQRERQLVRTAFGEASVTTARAGGRTFAFVSRHGEEHTLAPHEINYRANIAAIRELGIRRVLATNAVGSLVPEIAKDEIVILSDFLDFTRGRPSTFRRDGSGEPVIHTAMTDPYCPELHLALCAAANRLHLPIRDAVYVCVDGPRYESPAEVRMYATLGGQVVGMTGLPEAVLAREAGLCYAAIGVVTNQAAGIAREPISHAAVQETMSQRFTTILRLLDAVASDIPVTATCACNEG